jgi:predicted DNA-binding transcriptional regulator AlpA
VSTEGIRLTDLVKQLPLTRSSVYELIKALEVQTIRKIGPNGSRVSWIESDDQALITDAAFRVNRGESHIRDFKRKAAQPASPLITYHADLSTQTLPDAIASLVDAWLTAQNVEPVQQPLRREPRQYDPSEPQVRFTVDLPKSLHKRLKLAAINGNKPMTEMARDALADWLDMSEVP